MSAAAIRFLTTAEVIRLHQTLIPKEPLRGETDIFKLAASLSSSLMKNHPFGDGNKRTALLAADAFLKRNGYQFKDIKESGIERAHVAVVTNQLDADKLHAVYRKYAKKV
ncbi:DOC family protein [Penicillium macrosclerotiorum]|uniref:DOC family protein n=1 Tax=Penicillium macrosclerotiorum TaxID=303699 RepID=UPI0025484909|nr:DOC family protein [Penicillium macrosclerotiorum]KAJ5679093.1 DOC family protein [Penicillium macrosclerotiorum]